jgi:PleD family two-component response regulator
VRAVGDRKRAAESRARAAANREQAARMQVSQQRAEELVAGSTITIGLAEMLPEDSLEDLLDRADAALLVARGGSSQAASIDHVSTISAVGEPRARVSENAV